MNGRGARLFTFIRKERMSLYGKKRAALINQSEIGNY